MLLRDTGEERSRHLDLREHFERPRGEAVAPSRRVDPVGHLALTVHGDAIDRHDEGAAVIDRPEYAVGIVSDPLVVTVERGAIRRIGAREGRHGHSMWVALLLEA